MDSDLAAGTPDICPRPAEAVGATASAVASGSSSASALPTRPYTPQILNPSWSLKEISWPESRVGGMRRGVKIVCQVCYLACDLTPLNAPRFGQRGEGDEL